MSNGDQFTDPPAPPDTVIVADLMQSEADPRKKATLEALGQNDGNWFTNFWAAFIASIKSGMFKLLTEFALSLDQVLAFVGKFFILGQGEKNSPFYDLAGQILEDLTGVPVDTAALKNSAFGSGRLAGMMTFGGDLYTELQKEFAPATGSLDTPSTDPAKAFLGFLMNFAIRQGNIELLTSLLPESWRIGDGYRAYGELMAKNLGLGRLARRALTPLIQTLVADPLQYSLNKQYTPKRLGAVEAIKANFRDEITDAELQEELLQQGYSIGRQTSMIADARTILSDREIVHLFLANLIDKPTMATELAHRGWEDTDVDFVLAIETPQLTKIEILDLYIFGQIARTEAITALLLQGYGSANAENIVLLAEMKAQIVHPKHPLHAKHRAVAQLRKEYIDGVINLIDWNTALMEQGYSDTDIAALTQDLLLDAAKAPKGTRAKAIPKLTIAQLKTAYNAKILSREEVTAHLEARGYAQDDVNTLLAEDFPPQVPPVA